MIYSSKSRKIPLKTWEPILKKAFQNSLNTYWKNRISKLSTRNPNQLFPNYRNIFQVKEHNNIETLKIPITDSYLIEKVNLNPSDRLADTHSLYHISKLNILGSRFESVLVRNSNIENTSLANVIKEQTVELVLELQLDRLDNRTITSSTPENLAHNPYAKDIPPNCCTNFYDYELII